MRKLYFILATLILVLQLCGNQIALKVPNNQPKKPNVLYILTDNQSYYELSSHGHSIVKTPHIDKFASEGVIFDNFYATPYCSPSRAEMQTGRYALRYGIHTTIGGVSNLSPSEKIVSNYLKEKGYKTGVFGKWHLGNEYPYNPVDRGFDVSFIHDGGGIGQLPDYYGNNHIDAVYNSNGEYVKSKGFSSDVLFKEAKKFMESNKDEPFYCFVSTPATHSPWQAHPEKLKELKDRGVTGNKNNMALYSMIENIDDNIGDLLSYLEESGLKENTLVIIATDQGMGYRGMDYAPEEKRFGSRPEVFDNKHKVFCMMQLPGAKSNGRKNKSLTGIIDITPTILDACNIPVTDNMDGRSLVPFLNGKDDWDDDRTLIVQCPRARKRDKYRNASVKTKKWRLIDGKLLFDAINDPYQLNNIADEYREVVDSLNTIHSDFWNSLPSENDVKLYDYIGGDKNSEIRLNCMDWYKGSMPWGNWDIPKTNINGTWAIKVLKKSSCQFELRQFPREYEKAIGAQLARIQIGDKMYSQKLDSNESSILFNIELDEGEYDLNTFLYPKEQVDPSVNWGAKFVYVKTL